jgi:hypothetical protein
MYTIGAVCMLVGALMYYWAFYRSRLVPRWLSGWGLAGVLLLLAACLAALFTRSPVTSYTVLIVPIAVQEMVLAVWLIARGFGARDPGPADEGRTAPLAVRSAPRS